MKQVLSKIFWCFHDFSAYKVVSLIGLIIRVVFLPMMAPNIFNVIAAYFINQLALPVWVYEIVLRVVLLIVDGIGLMTLFYLFAFITVGNSYERGTEPVWGSICYSIFYTIYWVIPVIFFNFFEWWVIAVTYAFYALICAAVYLISAFVFDTLPDGGTFTIRLSIHIVVFTLFVVGTCLLKAFVF